MKPAKGPPSDVLERFGVLSARPKRLHEGHINSTWLASGLVIQRINAAVFPDPRAAASRLHLAAAELRSERVKVPQPVGPVVDGSDGGVWRAYRYVEGRTPLGAFVDERSGMAFGAFAAGLAHLDATEVPVTIPGFHDFPARVRQLHDAARAGRRTAERELTRARATIAVIEARPEYEAWARLPARVVHNDAKRANLIKGRDRAFYVLDLDTVGAGSLLYDVGELIRSAVREDAESIGVSQDRIDLVVKGYLRGWGQPLSPAEEIALPIAGLMMTAENAIRFLADYLTGDRYFGVTYPKQNLDRSRIQLRLAEQLASLL